MKFKATKLDKRMNGYGSWSHRIDFFWGGVKDWNHVTSSPTYGLHLVRCWLWENYGPGAELRLARSQQLLWAWDTDNDYCRIYVNTDILVALQLKFG